METKKKNVQCHLFFELENTAFPGRAIAFEAMKNALQKKEVEISRIDYVKHGLKSLPAFALPALLKAAGKGSVATKMLDDEVRKAILEKVTKDSLNQDLKKLIAAAKEKGMKVCALSAFDNDMAGSMMDTLGLGEMGVELLTYEDHVRDEFPRVDVFMLMLREMELEPRACLMLATSAASCKAALTVDFATVAVPDEFTQIQDFSGAHYVLDSLGDMKSAQLIDTMLAKSK